MYLKWSFLSSVEPFLRSSPFHLLSHSFSWSSFLVNVNASLFASYLGIKIMTAMNVFSVSSSCCSLLAESTGYSRCLVCNSSPLRLTTTVCCVGSSQAFLTNMSLIFQVASVFKHFMVQTITQTNLMERWESHLHRHTCTFVLCSDLGIDWFHCHIEIPFFSA